MSRKFPNSKPGGLWKRAWRLVAFAPPGKYPDSAACYIVEMTGQYFSRDTALPTSKAWPSLLNFGTRLENTTVEQELRGSSRKLAQDEKMCRVPHCHLGTLGFFIYGVPYLAFGLVEYGEGRQHW